MSPASRCRTFSGISVSPAADINGDGLADVIIGADGGSQGGLPHAGEAYVIFGATSGLNGIILTSTLAPPTGVTIKSDAPGDYAGLSVSSAGDVWEPERTI